MFITWILIEFKPVARRYEAKRLKNHYIGLIVKLKYLLNLSEM